MENKRITNQFSRRDFFKTASMAAAGGVLMSTLPTETSANVQGSDRLKIAIIGCGGRGTGAANLTLALEKGVQLVAMADVFRDRLDDSYDLLSQRYGDTEKIAVPEENKFIGLDSYKHATALADVVLLTAPPGFRPMHFAEAVAQGKHIFMEKPLGTDAPGIRIVLESAKIARDKKLSVVVGLQRRYQDNYLRAYEHVQNGAIGEIISGQVYWNSRGVWVRPRLPEYTELEYQLRNWFYFNWICGDHILEQHIHQIDVANWFIGEYPVSAQGMGGREVRTGKEFGQIFDHHFVEFTYPSGAVIASQCRHQPNTFFRVAETFQSTKGHINLDGQNRGLLQDRSLNTIYDHDGIDDPDPYQVEMAVLIDSIRKGTPVDDTDFGAKTTMAALMGRMATYSGQVITWDQAMNAKQKLVPDTMDWNSTPPVLPDVNGYYPVPVPGEANVLV